MSIKVFEVPTNAVVGKTVKEVIKYIVADEEDKLTPIDGKLHDDIEAAKLAKEDLKFKAVGLEFGRKAYPDLSAKAQIAKANIVMEFLKWDADGRPVKEPKAKAPAAPAPSDQQTQEQAGSEDF